MTNFKTPKVIAVDVDGTLYNRGILNTYLVEWLKDKKQEQYYIILWSMNGKEHAERVAREYNIENLFDIIISKPGFIVDDMGWSWVKHTKVVNSFCMDNIDRDCPEGDLD